MKKNIIITFFIVTTVNSFAQVSPYQSIPIVHDTVIQWSAICNKVINLTPVNNEFSLKKWYLDKLIKSTVNAYTATGSKLVSVYSLSLPRLEKQDWLKGLSVEPPQSMSRKEWYFADNTKSKDDYERFKYRAGINLSADSCCGCDEADAFSAKQILKYKNGKFSIHNFFISPLCARQTVNPPLQWYPLCNVAYNDNANRKFPGEGKDVVLLSTDEVDYNFDSEAPSAYDSVLSVNGTDIGSLIYQDILKGNLKPIDVESGKPIPVKKLLTLGMAADTIAVIDPDDAAKVIAYKVMQQQRSSTDFNRIRIKQDMYFDFKNERLFSVVRSVTLMQVVRMPDGNIRGQYSYCRLE